MNKFLTLGAALVMSHPICINADDVIVSTDAYQWVGDSILQGVYKAYAPGPYQIVSDYSAQPGYYMGIEKEWKLKNDITVFPQLRTPNRLHQAIYNMGLDEMVNAVEPDTTLRTGKEWAGVWTRDVSYSILLSMAYLQPEASMISLRKKVDKLGRIIQDTGSGGAWPVSTDREIWAIAAFEVYKATGNREWLEFIYPVIRKSLETDRNKVYDSKTGLVKGETSFIDWREQSHPKWMQTADIFNTESLSTSVVHAEAWRVLSEIAGLLGDKTVERDALEESKKISDAINKYLWMDDKGYYAMYRYGRDNMIVNPRAETLGESLAIMWNIADSKRALEITENNPTTPFGVAVFYPQIADMPAYHNNSLWPWVGAWWTMANAKAGNEEGVLEGFGALFRPAALFCTNKENFNLDNGDIATELNSSNMLWCLSGNLALTHKVLFGIDYKTDGLAFHPFVPRSLAADRSLTGFKYRDAVLDINISGYGNKIKSFKVNGKEQSPFISESKAQGKLIVDIVLADEFTHSAAVNRVKNTKAPLTPVAWLEGRTLVWNPIEYIAGYKVVKDGKVVAETRSTTFDASLPGEYQVIGVSSDGVESFASEPKSTRETEWFEITGEGAQLSSLELSYIPESGIKGYLGEGFAEIDHKVEKLDVPVKVGEDGSYFIQFRYSNGNGPVNTENKCAIRTMYIDGQPAGTLVFPQRGRNNWNEWGWTNSVEVPLISGDHVISLVFGEDDENMNMYTNHALLDGVRLVKKP